MTVLRTALEASLTDPRFVGDELIPTLSVGTTAHLTSMRPRLAGPSDQDEVSAELSTPDGELVFLTAFGREEDAESTYRVLDALWTTGLGGGSRHRVPQPLAYMHDWWVVVTALPSGTPLSSLIDSRALQAPAAVKDAGAWLADLHASKVRIGSPWLPWRSATTLADHLRPFPAKLAPSRNAMRRMLRALAPHASRSMPPTMVQTHGRFRDDRVLIRPDGVTVHDLSQSVPGDPARDVAEFLFHLRLRAFRIGDPRGEDLTSLFLDGYLEHAPERHLTNLSYYVAFSILTSLARLIPRETPSDPGWGETVEFHLDEFDRLVVAETRTLMPA